MSDHAQEEGEGITLAMLKEEEIVSIVEGMHAHRGGDEPVPMELVEAVLGWADKTRMDDVMLEGILDGMMVPVCINDDGEVEFSITEKGSTRVETLLNMSDEDRAVEQGQTMIKDWAKRAAKNRWVPALLLSLTADEPRQLAILAQPGKEIGEVADLLSKAAKRAAEAAAEGKTGYENESD